MSGAHDAADDRAQGDGSTTAVEGTPVAVDVSRDRRARVIWVVFLAGPVIWFAHFMVVYLIAEAGCTGEGPGLSALAPPVPTIATLAVTAVAAVGCLWCAWWGYRRWRDNAEDPEPDVTGDLSGDLPQDDRGGTLAFVGFLLSSLSFVTVLLVGVPAAVLPPC